MDRMTPVHRGDVWWVTLDPTVGVEIKKTRPALVVSNDIANQCSGLVTILPFTDVGEKLSPVEIEVPAKFGGLSKISKIKCEHIRAVDRKRLVSFMGALPDQIMLSTERALCLHLGLDPSTHL